MALEQLFLDPPEVAADRTELALHNGAIIVAQAGPNWGDAVIEQYLADAARGSVPVDFRIPNRTVELPLMLGASTGAMTFDGARTALQQKAALIQREGGWLKRVLRDGRVVYLDVIDAALHMGGGTFQAQRDLDADVVLTLQTLPDWYGDEEDLGAVASASPHLIFTLPAVSGDYPARTRLVVTDASGNAQGGLLWGLRSRHYDAAATAALAYQAEALTPLDAAASATVLSTAVIRHASLSTGWTPVLSTEIAGVGQMTHTGSYRVWTRAHTTSLTPPRLRLLWDVGDLVAPVTNPAVTIAGPNGFQLVNLGAVRLDAPPIGAHRWQGAIQAAAEAAGDNVSIDRLWLFPIDEGYGELRAPVVSGDDPGLAGYSARDEFDQATGALNGNTLPRGGTWASSGDADDFSLTGSGSVQRTAVSDTFNTGRYAVADTPVLTTTLVQADVSATAGGVVQAVLARYTDANNWLRAKVQWNNGSDALLVSVEKRVAGTVTGISGGLSGLTLVPITRTATVTLRLVVDANGRWAVYLFRAGEQAQLVVAGNDTALATGGALASGKVGINDEYTSSPANTRTYDNFAAWAPAFDAVVNASLAAELRTDGMFRQSADGNGYGQVSHVIGDLPRLPAAGMEGRTTEVILKSSRGEPGVDADPASDAISAHVYARPSWLFVPAA